MKFYLLIIAGTIAGMALGYWRDAEQKPSLQFAKQELKKTEEAPVPIPVIPAFIDSIPPPSGYTIVRTSNNTFGKWLLRLPLRQSNVLYLYNGTPKPIQSLHYAVLNVPYNRNPLQQCADAVMRLRAEYLYATKAEPVIRFFHQKNEYFSCSSHCSRPQLENFLNQVFSWCGTYNLQAQLHPVSNMQQIQTGDVFVKGGSPGHAMLGAAVAQNKQSKKIFLLLQSFIPAQDIHIVKNTFNESLSPWYDAGTSKIITPGYVFQPQDLRRW